MVLAQCIGLAFLNDLTYNWTVRDLASATSPSVHHPWTWSEATGRGGGAAGAAPWPRKASSAAEHLRWVFHRQGFSDQDIVVLSGAHSIGRAHKDRSGLGPPPLLPLPLLSQPHSQAQAATCRCVVPTFQAGFKPHGLHAILS